MRALPLLLVLACGTEDPGKRGDSVDPACDAEGPDQILLTRTLSFERAEAGVSMGFDLDQVDTLDGMSEGCGVEDFVGIDGTPGIDNAMANLLRVFADRVRVAQGRDCLHIARFYKAVTWGCRYERRIRA